MKAAETTMRGRSAWHLAPAVAAIFALTLLPALLGNLLHALPDPVRPIWLANAGTLAIALRADRRMRPGLLAALVAATVFAKIEGEGTPGVAAGLALANLVEVGVALRLIARSVGRRADFGSIRNLGAFLLLAGLAAPLASALVAAIALLLAGEPRIGVEAARWFVAHALGMLVLGPLLVTVDRPTRRTLSRTRLHVETVAILLLAALVTAAVFFQSPYPMLFVILPVLTFAAFRLRFVGTACAIAVTSMIATAFTLAGHGPIAHSIATLTDRILFLQAFLALAVVATLPVAALLADRDRLSARVTGSERRFRQLADAAPIGMFRADDDGIVGFANPSWVAMGGHAVGVHGESWLESVAPEGRDEAERLWSAALANGEGFSCDLPLRRHDGAAGQAYLTLVRPADDSEEAVGWIGVAADIDDRHRAEQATMAAMQQLTESHRLLTMAEAIAGVGHWRLDAATTELYWSDEVYRIHGVERGDIRVLAEGVDAYVPEDRERVRAHVEAAMTNGAGWSLNGRLRRPSGEVRHVLAHGQAERAADGRIVGLFGVFQDVTDRVEAERALIAARDAAQAAAAARSAFLATMSHEIRTPMTGVLGMLELLRANPAPADRERFFDSLEQSANLLMTVLDDVLDFSKIESGNLRLETIDFDFAEMGRGMLDLFHNGASRKGLILTFAAPSGQALLVRGDPVRLRQVIANMVSNAIKFTDQGAVELRLGVTPGETGRRRIRCSVIDTGIGIPEAAAGQLFQPFVQVDDATTRRFGGTGLGLAISRRLIEAMGGRIGVDPTPGGGSTFWFEVDLEAGVAPLRPESVPRAAAKRSLSVLVAEDNKVNQLLISSLVARDGHRVTCVDNGRLAVEAAAAARYDAILMDMQMPELDGLGAARAIRVGEGPCRDVPIIALTADASPERRARYDDPALTAFLTKPIESNLLSRTLSGIAEEPVREAAPPPRPAAGAPLDTAKLDELDAALGPANVDRLMAMFVEELRRQPGAIARLVAEGCLTRAAQEAHSLKGAALGLGAARVAAAARAIELLDMAAGDGAGAVDDLLEAASATLAAAERRQRAPA